MNYLNDCLDFIEAERKANKKELYRLINLEDSEHNDEGQTLNKVRFVSKTKNGFLYKYPSQFCKFREEKRVDIYLDKRKVSENGAEIVSIDHLKNEIVLDVLLNEKTEYLLVASLEIVPYAVINSLKKMIQEPSLLATNIIERDSNFESFGEFTQENVIKSVKSMNNGSFIFLQGCPGAGKTYTGKNIIKHLVENKNKILVTSNSHRAITNLLESLDFEFKGVKLCSRDNQKIENKNFTNRFPSGKEIDNYVDGFDIVAGTCFALSKIKDLKYDFIIVDEASQLKMSFLLAISRLAKKVIVLGDQNQLQSISPIEQTSGGESIFDYVLEKNKIVPSHLGYLLDTTYRMEPQIASLISKVFYEGKMKWKQTKNLEGVNLIESDHSHGQKISEEEAKDVLKVYKKLRAKKVKPEDILITTPYNAQVALIKSLVHKKTVVGTTDLIQGGEADFVIISCVSAGNKAQSAEFATNPNRLNVAISRAKKGAYLVASKGLINSGFVSKEFKNIISELKKNN